MNIYVGADHNGFAYKQAIVAFLTKSGYSVVDVGDLKRDPEDDFPVFAKGAVTKLLGDPDTMSRAILICGSGQGMAMAANRFKGIRAALCWNLNEARSSRNDDDSNVLCLSAQNVDQKEAQTITMAWLNTPFAGAPRFRRRLEQMDTLG
ncbi:MAG: Sugar-phosphate isomerase, RpiB/LacA/LacB family [Candidatus Saccharibacteria bacterium]|nr:Sugar-phosphate isomerase, RpiB/LacA/LacB family [Candidatus Saccharibacteria bacterium]